jgi:hypothetical protein
MALERIVECRQEAELHLPPSCWDVAQHLTVVSLLVSLLDGRIRAARAWFLPGPLGLLGSVAS